MVKNILKEDLVDELKKVDVYEDAFIEFSDGTTRRFPSICKINHSEINIGKLVTIQYDTIWEKQGLLFSELEKVKNKIDIFKPTGFLKKDINYLNSKNIRHVHYLDSKIEKSRYTILENID